MITKKLYKSTNIRTSYINTLCWGIDTSKGSGEGEMLPANYLQDMLGVYIQTVNGEFIEVSS